MQLQQDFSKQRNFVMESLLVSLAVFCICCFILPSIFYAVGAEEAVTPLFMAVYNYVLMLMIFFVLQFTVAAMALRGRFNLLNNYLRYISNTASFSEALLFIYSRLCFKSVDRVDALFHLEKFFKTHHELCEGIDLLNSTFTCHLTPVLINSLTIKTLTAYGLLWEVISPADFSAAENLQNVFWLMVMLILEVTISFAGSTLTQAAQEASGILTRVLNNSISHDALNVSMQNFITRLNGRKLHVRNCFIKINWSILVHVRTFFRKIQLKLYQLI